MSIFKNTLEVHKRVDYQIFSNGWFQLYFSSGAIGLDKTWLETEGYEIAEFSCHGFSNLMSQFNEYFSFPAYFHHNLNSLNDCMRDVEIKKIGLVIILKNIEGLKKDARDGLSGC